MGLFGKKKKKAVLTMDQCLDLTHEEMLALDKPSLVKAALLRATDFYADTRYGSDSFNDIRGRFFVVATCSAELEQSGLTGLIAEYCGTLMKHLVPSLRYFGDDIHADLYESFFEKNSLSFDKCYTENVLLDIPEDVIEDFLKTYFYNRHMNDYLEPVIRKNIELF